MQNEHEILHIDVSVIDVLPDRQRTDLGDLESLKGSMAQIGLINPIAVASTGDNIYLLAGERRLKAAIELGWKTIPCSIWLEDMESTTATLIELEENIKRKTLDWKEEALACIKLHDQHCALDEKWNVSNTADVLSIGGRTASRLLSVGRALEQGNDTILMCPSISSAAAALSRQTQRNVDDETAVLLDNVNVEITNMENLDDVEVVLSDKIMAQVKENLAEEEADSDEPKLKSIRSAKHDVLEADFCEWAALYDGPAFQVINLDPPYGIKHHKSEQGGSAIYGAYKDEEENFWKILETLADNRDRLVAKRAHILLWFSMKHYNAIFNWQREWGLAEEWNINKFPLIWHKADNIGIVPDAKRYGRRVYETALLISVGDRQINDVRPNLVSLTSDKSDAQHLSEKPFKVMNLMLFPLIQPEREVNFLDPTCGSGTAIAAAEFLGAVSVTGLDIDPKSVAQARRTVNSWRLRSVGQSDMDVNSLSENELLDVGD